jgi:hypothetical protein
MFSNSNSFYDRDARWLPWVFRAGLPVPVTGIMGA